MTEAVFGGGGSAPERAAKPALVAATSGRTLSYDELAAAVASIATGLVRTGLGPGTVIALHLPDSPEFAVALHAAFAAGAVPFPVRATVTATELARLLAEAGARALVTWPVMLDIARRAAKSADVDRVLCFGDEPDAEPFSGLTTGAAKPPETAVKPADLALLAGTRGSAGRVRCVPLTHADVSGGLFRVAEAGMIGGSDVVLSALPLADVLGLNGVLNPALRLGATVVTLSGAGRDNLLRAVQDQRVTMALVTPETVEMLALDRVVPRYHLRSLRAVVAVGGPLRAEVARACATRLGCPVRQAYGLAEAAGLTHLNLRAAEEGTLDSVGRGLLGVRWSVTDSATGAEQPAYQAGELCVRVLDRWVRSGDSAFADEHGRVFILGRLGERGPEPPAEPEAVLAAHPAVREAVVAPAPDPELGLVPHAFVVLDEQIPAEVLLDYVNAHVPSYRSVPAVTVVDLIPRSPSGRVLRRALLERAGLGS
ncbi:4-coumarate--CoA ligase family protein [Actinomadura fulvescens]|uniref:4-coumarate--CoA ligase family protein n=1 Tax=Actinomadura fulvescens TaxID=46160 RepID=A0ABP6C033_9ACTN